MLYNVSYNLEFCFYINERAFPDSFRKSWPSASNTNCIKTAAINY